MSVFRRRPTLQPRPFPVALLSAPAGRTPVQAAALATATGHTSTTPTLGAGATAGNVLVATVAVDKSAGAFDAAPSGWTAGPSFVDGNISIHTLYRTAAGGETSVTLSWTTSQTYSGATISEWDGVQLAGFLSNSANSGGAGVTSQGTGSVSNSGAGTALVWLGVDSQSAFSGVPPTWGGGFEVVLDNTDAVDVNPGFPGFSLAVLDVTAGTTSSTASWSGSDQAAAAILFFPEAGSAVTISPDPASVAGGVVDPTVVAGSLSLSPATASAATSVVDPTVAFAALVEPAAASAATSVVDPTVVRGALSLSPATASAASSVVDPAPVFAPGAALRFYGSSTDNVDRVRIPRTNPARTVATAVDVGAGDFTIEWRMRCAYADNTTAVTDARYCNPVVDGDVYGEAMGMVLGVTQRSSVLVVIIGVAGPSLTWTSVRGTINVGDGAYHHVAVTRNQATGAITIWVDGVADGSGTYSTGDLSFPLGHTSDPAAVNDEYWVIGAEKHDETGTASYTGLLDELRFSDTVRYTSTFTPATEPFDDDGDTVGLYHLDSSSGTTAIDSAAAGPTNGELLVGGASSGPTWDGRVAFVPGITVEPGAASAATSVVSPTVVAGSLSLAPTTASAASAVVAPTVALGSTSSAPDPATTTATTADPTVAMGALSIAPAAASAASTVVDPTVVRGALSVAPDAVASATAVVDPTVVRGAVAVAPDPASASTAVVNPTVARGSSSVAPEPASSGTAVVDPAVSVGGALVEPGAASAVGSVVDPTVVQGALSVAPAAASSTPTAEPPVVVLGSLSLAPASAAASPTVVDPSVAEGGVALAPDPAVVAGSVADPTVARGALMLSPAAAVALALAETPAVQLGGLSVGPGVASGATSTANPTVLTAAAITGVVRIVVGTPRQPRVVVGTPRQPRIELEDL